MSIGKKKVVCIDPGSRGSICEAIINNDDKKVEKIVIHRFTGDMKKNSETIKSVIENDNNIETKIFVEKVHSMPSDGVVSAFTFGTNFGFILGCIYSCNKDCDYVYPSGWKRMFTDKSIPKEEFRTLKRYEKKKIINNIIKEKVFEKFGKEVIEGEIDNYTADSCGILIYCLEKKGV